MSSPGSQEDIQALIDALNEENPVEPIPDVVYPYYFDDLNEEAIESDNASVVLTKVIKNTEIHQPK